MEATPTLSNSHQPHHYLALTIEHTTHTRAFTPHVSHYAHCLPYFTSTLACLHGHRLSNNERSHGCLSPFLASIHGAGGASSQESASGAAADRRRLELMARAISKVDAGAGRRAPLLQRAAEHFRAPNDDSAKLLQAAQLLQSPTAANLTEATALFPADAGRAVETAMRVENEHMDKMREFIKDRRADTAQKLTSFEHELSESGKEVRTDNFTVEGSSGGSSTVAVESDPGRSYVVGSGLRYMNVQNPLRSGAIRLWELPLDPTRPMELPGGKAAEFSQLVCRQPDCGVPIVGKSADYELCPEHRRRFLASIAKRRKRLASSILNPVATHLDDKQGHQLLYGSSQQQLNLAISRVQHIMPDPERRDCLDHIMSALCTTKTLIAQYRMYFNPSFVEIGLMLVDFCQYLVDNVELITSAVQAAGHLAPVIAQLATTLGSLAYSLVAAICTTFNTAVLGLVGGLVGLVGGVQALLAPLTLPLLSWMLSVAIVAVLTSLVLVLVYYALKAVFSVIRKALGNLDIRPAFVLLDDPLA